MSTCQALVDDLRKDAQLEKFRTFMTAGFVIVLKYENMLAEKPSGCSGNAYEEENDAISKSQTSNRKTPSYSNMKVAFTVLAISIVVAYFRGYRGFHSRGSWYASSEKVDVADPAGSSKTNDVVGKTGDTEVKLKIVYVYHIVLKDPSS